jgi:hypothetical protein
VKRGTKRSWNLRALEPIARECAAAPGAFPKRGAVGAAASESPSRARGSATRADEFSGLRTVLSPGFFEQGRACSRQSLRNDLLHRQHSPVGPDVPQPCSVRDRSQIVLCRLARCKAIPRCSLHLASPPPRFGYSAVTPGDPARPHRGTPGTDRDFLLSTGLGSSHERARVGFHAGWFGRLRRNPRPSIPIKTITPLDGSGTLTNETLSITAS